MSGDDHWLAEGDAGLDRHALDRRERFEGALDSEISPSHHERIAFLDNAVDVRDRRLVLYLGNYLGVVGAVLVEIVAKKREVRGFANEGEGVEVDTFLNADVYFSLVLFGQGWEVDLDAREIDMATAGELAGNCNLAILA